MHKIIKRKEKRTNYPVINGERSSDSGTFSMLKNNFPQQLNGKDIVDVRFQNTFSNFNLYFAFLYIDKNNSYGQAATFKKR